MCLGVFECLWVFLSVFRCVCVCICVAVFDFGCSGCVSVCVGLYRFV